MRTLLSRLTLTRKLAILGVLGAALVASLVALLVVQSNREIEAAKLEQAGIAPFDKLLRVIQLTQQHRGLAGSVLGGNAAGEAQWSSQDLVDRVSIPDFRRSATMSARLSAGRVRQAYRFIEKHRKQFSVQQMCRVLEVAPSGYYEWLKNPLSNRAQEDARLLRLIRASFNASHGIYGAPRVFLDLREAGETCSKHRVTRLMRENGLRALHGYRTRPMSVGKPAVLIPNVLQRQCTVSQPNKVWVTDITYIRTWQGWLYLAVVMDLYSRNIVGWSTGQTITRELVLDAVLEAVRHRRPRGTLIHSDQGTQYGSDAWRRFCKSNRLSNQA